MRYFIATLACAAILAAAFIATPLLRDHGLPTGGLLMILVAAALAWTWISIMRPKKPDRDE